MVVNASLIAVSEGNYLVQARNVYVPKFKSGEYPFTFPGACSLFGGEVEEGESPTQAFQRELKEEMEGIQLPENLEHRFYDWGKQVDEVLGRADKAFHGNVASFLGFDLYSCIQQCALGRERGKDVTFRGYLTTRQEHFYVANIVTRQNIKAKEGAKSLWLPHEATRALVMYPGDKLAILDDIAKRVESGEIKLK